MSTIAERKAIEKTERVKAEERKYSYYHAVVEPEIEERCHELYPIIMERAAEDSEESRWVEVTLTVDGRSYVLDPGEPWPLVGERKYRVKAKAKYYDHVHHIHVEEWRYRKNWSGHFREGQDAWCRVSNWHKLQVLRALLKKEAVDDPSNHEGAIMLLLRFCEAHTDLMSQAQLAALSCSQFIRQDPASKVGK